MYMTSTAYLLMRRLTSSMISCSSLVAPYEVITTRDSDELMPSFFHLWQAIRIWSLTECLLSPTFYISHFCLFWTKIKIYIRRCFVVLFQYFHLVAERFNVMDCLSFMMFDYQLEWHCSKTDNFADIRRPLEGLGYKFVRVKNTLKDESAVYRGVNTQVKTPDGYTFEIQFHTPQSLAIKEKNHVLYEQARVLDLSTLDGKKPKWWIRAPNVNKLTDNLCSS